MNIEKDVMLIKLRQSQKNSDSPTQTHERFVRWKNSLNTELPEAELVAKELGSCSLVTRFLHPTRINDLKRNLYRD